MDKRTDEKKSRLLGSLDLGMTMVHLDARRPGVIVPTELKQAHLALNLSYRFDPPDLAVSDWGVRSTLTFSGKRFTVGLPWSCIYGISSHVSGEFWMYPDDIPKEVLESATARQLGPQPMPAPAEGAPDAPPAPSPDEARQVLMEVLSSPVPKPEEPEQKTPVRRGHLRVVK